MLVAALTSVFIIATPGGNYIHPQLPNVFIISTIVILGSSGTLHLAGLRLKQLRFDSFKLLLALTIALGIIFILLQGFAWAQLVNQKLNFDLHKGFQSFIYVFVAVHFLHILSGIILLLYTLMGSIKNRPYYRLTFRMEVSTIFWHFIDLLWIYLYFFLLIRS